jgi:hypothetical protein
MRASQIILLLLCVSNGWAQQNAGLLLSTVGGNDFISAGEETYIYEGKITKEEVLIEESNAGENVELKIKIENTISASDDYIIQLINPAGIDSFGYQILDGSIYITDNFDSFLLTSNPGSGYFLDIVRCGNTIFYVHENKIIYCREIGYNNFQLNAQVHVDIALDAGVDIAIHSLANCDLICESPKEQYLVLDDFIDWREHILTDSILKFKYVEKYSIAESYNDVIKCQLLDNQNNILFTEEMANQYGINMQDWIIPGIYLTVGEYYVFRVFGINKGKTYNIRIRYDGS